VKVKRGKIMNDGGIGELIARNDFLSNLDNKFKKLLAANAVEREFAAGNVVFRQGEKADKFYLLLSGHVSVEIPTVYGPTLTIQDLGAGQILGWSWLISPFEWDFQAMVREPTRVVEFDGSALLGECEANPEFGYALLKGFTELMSERLTAARQRMMDEWSPAGFA
jgi:CRP/FNR family cyclic AMP-dependent transcriptional regulator